LKVSYWIPTFVGMGGILEAIIAGIGAFISVEKRNPEEDE
jgi:hypothetical protein